MKKTTPLVLLLLSILIWAGCTPENKGPGTAATPGILGTRAEKIADQELILETVGLKFVITVETRDDHEITFVTWDYSLRDEFLRTHPINGVDLQIRELQIYLDLVDAQQDTSNDPNLETKRILAERALKSLQ